MDCLSFDCNKKLLSEYRGNEGYGDSWVSQMVCDKHVSCVLFDQRAWLRSLYLAVGDKSAGASMER